jgi:hypothetical protein
MELILNLVWLMLFVPAAVVCLRAQKQDRHARFAGRFRSVVVMGSVLVLVFPLISATDDLMALRADVEESGSSRVVKSGVVDISDSRDLFSFHIMPARIVLVGPPTATLDELSQLSIGHIDSLFFQTAGSRAPPVN